MPWDGLANSISIVFWALVLFAIINSTLANAIAGTNVFTRTAYAFGRAGVFPSSLAKLNAKHRSPQNALILQLVLGLVIALALGAKYGPTTAFGIVATGLVVVVVVVYALTNLACIGYFTKHRREERHPVLHVLVPVLGFLFLVPGFLNSAGITGVPGLKFIAALPTPLSYGAWAMGIWTLVGVGALFYLRSTAPAASANKNTGPPPPAAAAAPTTAAGFAGKNLCGNGIREHYPTACWWARHPREAFSAATWAENRAVFRPGLSKLALIASFYPIKVKIKSVVRFQKVPPNSPRPTKRGTSGCRPACAA